jgi:circadian clock protein KaiB
VSAPSNLEADGPPDDGLWLLTLYVSGQSTKSLMASANLTRLCEAHLHDRYSVETIDLAKEPSRARSDDIFVIPTLIRRLPTPVRRFVGDLSNCDRVLVER